MIIGIQDEILRLHSLGLLNFLLKDKTTKSNILWATEVYQNMGTDYGRDKEIKTDLITGERSGVIRNRAKKALEQQTERTRQHAEVFTPLWICKQMNETADEGWFPKKTPRPFDSRNKIKFLSKKKWWRYVDARRLEITCGEAPYLVSRYDVSTGENIPIEERIGSLDHKLRVVNENTTDEAEWMKWTIRAFQSIYGYEFQGDNVLIARVNLLMTFEEYLEDRWKRKPTAKEYRKILNIIAWNIWQMDGLTGGIPFHEPSTTSCQLSLCNFLENASISLQKGNEPLCRLYDWRRDNSLEFLKINKGSKRKMKFDFVIGNPPYQDETVGQQKTFAPPIYHKFLENCYQIATKVEMIHPARFLFNAGNTPKQWNQSMLHDPHLKVVFYEQDSKKVFVNTDIKGGIAITYRDAKKHFGEIGVFTTYQELNSILKKVRKSSGFANFSSIVASRTAYRLTDKVHEDHPDAITQLSDGHAYDMSTNIFDRLPQVFFDEEPQDGSDYIRILGRIDNGRVCKYIKREYVNKVDNLDKWKVFLPSANGNGIMGELLSAPVVVAPAVGATETFVSIGCFETEDEAKAALKYIKTRFVRVLLGVLKVTQHITPKKWDCVPLQEFTSASDIDWSKSIPDIDKQLYGKYRLNRKEINFIESHSKEMNQ